MADLPDPDVAPPAEAEPAETPEPPGALTIADRVGRVIAERAALGVDDVVAYSTGVGSLAGGNAAVRAMVGGSYPRAQIDMGVASPRLSIEVALAWPSPVTQVCRRLRTHLTEELTRLTGVTPAAVDVAVAALVARTSAEPGETVL
ncbi:Asp23/Gls24 family envelope stress response protein [Gordonia sp. (in: high G+C Gram-positive bacteria)]|uniref:Asp23/Gls24 family envelope stress response protein n=1 Tax=Gordonia sp. (in: high G+C Gram-positive bacteria) TaxID=84139 RepID=UPI003528C02F